MSNYVHHVEYPTRNQKAESSSSASLHAVFRATLAASCTRVMRVWTSATWRCCQSRHWRRTCCTSTAHSARHRWCAHIACGPAAALCTKALPQHAAILPFTTGKLTRHRWLHLLQAFPLRSEALRQVVDLFRQHGANRRIYIRWLSNIRLFNPSEPRKLTIRQICLHTSAHLYGPYSDCSAEMLGCEAVLRHISKCFGDAKMYLEPTPSTSFAWLGPGKRVGNGAKPITTN